MGNYVQVNRGHKSNTKIKVFAALGVATGLGVASIPAFSYAANVSGDVQIDAEVESSLAMRIHSNADQTCSGDPEVCTDAYGFIGYNPATAQGSTDPAATASGVASQATGLSLSSNQADTTTLYSNISVRSNTGKFKLEVADADTDTAMRNASASTATNQYIPAGVTTTEENGETVINPGIAGWALKGGDITNWTAIVASTASPLTIKALDINATNPLAYSSDITVNYAVSSGLTKTDTYSDVITYTATALDSNYELTPQEGDTKTVAGVEYIYLKDGNWWTRSSQGSTTPDNAASLCPAGTFLPTADELSTLLSYYGGAPSESLGQHGSTSSSDALYNATGWMGSYWSSTAFENLSTNFYGLFSYGSGADVKYGYGYYSTDINGVLCHW